MGCGNSAAGSGPVQVTTESLPEGFSLKPRPEVGILSNEERKAARKIYLAEQAALRKDSHRSVLPPSPHQRRRGSLTHGTGNMGGFVMKFPKIREACLLLFEAFHGEAVQKGGKDFFLSIPKLLSILKRFDPNFAVPEEKVNASLKDIAHAADTPTELGFKDFMAACAVLCFLSDSDLPENTGGATVQTGLRIVYNQFHEMDSSLDGLVQVEELQELLLGSDAGHSRDNEVLDDRMKDLDLDGDGNVDFGEFLYGMSLWVDVDGHAAQRNVGATQD